MDYKGCCLWAPDIPNEDASHYVIVASNENSKKEYLVVAISSIKYKDDGTAKYYDDACVLSVDDITDANGKNILKKPSFIRYQYALTLNVDELLARQILGGYQLMCKISDSLLERIRLGGLKSKELPTRYLSFFKD